MAAFSAPKLNSFPRLRPASRRVSCSAELDLSDFAKMLDSQLKPIKLDLEAAFAKMLDSQLKPIKLDLEANQHSLQRLEQQLGGQAKQLGGQAKQLGGQAKLLGGQAKLLGGQAKLLGEQGKLLGEQGKQLGRQGRQLGEILEEQTRSKVADTFGASYAKPLLALSVQDFFLVFPEDALYQSPTIKEVYRAPLHLATKATERLVKDQIPHRLLEAFQAGVQAAAQDRLLTMEKLITNHVSKFAEDMDLKSLALRSPTMSEGFMICVLDKAAALAGQSKPINKQDLSDALDQLLPGTNHPWSNNGLLFPWTNEDGTIHLANLGQSLANMLDPPVKEALRRLKNVLSLEEKKQAEELLGCQSAGVLCSIAAAHPHLYLQPKLHLPSRELQWDLRGRIDIGLQSSYAYLDCGEAKAQGDFASAVTQLGLRLGVHNWLVQACFGVEPDTIRLVGRLFISSKTTSNSFGDEALREKAFNDWGFSLYIHHL